MGLGRITLALLAAPLLIGADSVDPLFKPCHGGMRVTCVVDGDTLWLAGDKIRLADINTPEVSRPAASPSGRWAKRRRGGWSRSSIAAPSPSNGPSANVTLTATAAS